MNCIISTVIILCITNYLLKKTWIGKSILIILLSIKGLCKNIYFSLKFIYKKINKTNKKLKQKINQEEKSNAPNPKIIPICSHKKVK